MTPKLSVVICSSGRKKSLKQCLRSLEKQSFKEFEIVVVATNLRLKTKNSRLKVRWLSDPRQGLASARDLGWRKAAGEIVSWIDDDVVVAENWAKNLLQIFEGKQNVGGVTGPTIVPEKRLKNRLVFWWYQAKGWLKPFAWLWVKLMLDNQPFAVGKLTKIGWWTPGSNFKTCLSLKGLVEVDYLEACNMSLRRELVKKVGGFDLSYRGTSEWCELDLARRIKNLGFRLVFSRQVRVEHRVSKAGAYLNRRKIGERISNYLKFHLRY
jgi:GT2 family glycosyltransferase